jgi:hypothetical protein
MIINLDKSTLSMWDILKHEHEYFSQLFPYQVIDMDQGLKYLGFHLKPNLYKKGDWKWLVVKVEKKINHWCNLWLSRGGRLVLVKAILEAILVCLISLAWVRKVYCRKLGNYVINSSSQEITKRKV